MYDTAQAQPHIPNWSVFKLLFIQIIIFPPKAYWFFIAAREQLEEVKKEKKSSKLAVQNEHMQLFLLHGLTLLTERSHVNENPVDGKSILN